MTPRWRAQDGSLTLELVILAPAILFILALVIAGGRVVIADQAVTQAASQAARDASLQPTPTAATATARSRADSVLDGQGLGCAPQRGHRQRGRPVSPRGATGPGQRDRPMHREMVRSRRSRAGHPHPVRDRDRAC